MTTQEGMNVRAVALGSKLDKVAVGNFIAAAASAKASFRRVVKLNVVSANGMCRLLPPVGLS